MFRTLHLPVVSCAIVLGGLAVPAASAFTLIELIDDRPTTGTRSQAPVPAKTPQAQPTPPAGPSSVAAEQKGPQPIGLLLPAVQKVRDEPRSCPPGEVTTPNGQGCQPAGLGTPPARR